MEEYDVACIGYQDGFGHVHVITNKRTKVVSLTVVEYGEWCDETAYYVGYGA